MVDVENIGEVQEKFRKFWLVTFYERASFCKVYTKNAGTPYENAAVILRVYSKRLGGRPEGIS